MYVFFWGIEFREGFYDIKKMLQRFKIMSTFEWSVNRLDSHLLKKKLLNGKSL